MPIFTKGFSPAGNWSRKERVSSRVGKSRAMMTSFALIFKQSFL